MLSLVFQLLGTLIFVSSLVSYFLFCKQTKQDFRKADGSIRGPDDELTCSICLEQVNMGELVRSLPCLHQVLPLSILNLDFFFGKR